MSVDQSGFYKMVGARIKHLRNSKNMSQSNLAAELGLRDRTVIARWESGDRQIPLHSLVDISNILGEDLDYLLGRGKVDRQKDYRIDKRRTASEPILQDPNDPYILHFMTPALASDLFPGSKQSDPRLLLFDRFISYLQHEEAFAHIYTSKELIDAIEAHFGVVIDLNDLSDFAEVFEPTAQNIKQHSAEAFVSILDKEITRLFREHYLPDDVVSEISSCVNKLKALIYDSGYSDGQFAAESKIEEDLEEQKIETSADVDSFYDDYDIDLTGIYEQSYEEGFSDKMDEAYGPQESDDL